VIENYFQIFNNLIFLYLFNKSEEKHKSFDKCRN